MGVPPMGSASGTGVPPVCSAWHGRPAHGFEFGIGLRDSVGNKPSKMRRD
jgi:hypothetical protein